MPVNGDEEHKRIEDGCPRETAKESMRTIELDILLSSIEDGLAIYDKSGHIISMNDAVRNAFGYAGDFCNTPLRDRVRQACVYHPDGRPFTCEEAPPYRALQGEIVRGVEILIKRGPERPTTILASAAPIKDKNGEITGAVFTFTDITERKRAEEALKKEQYILAKSQEVAHIGNWSWDAQIDKIDASAENYRILGYESSNIRPTLEWLLSRVHSDDRSALAEFWESRMQFGDRGSIDYRILRPDGSLRYVNTIVDKVVKDAAGKVKRMYGINQDVTERKLTEKALRDSRARLASTFRAAPTGIGVVVDRVITEVNDRLCEMVGYSREELLGQSAHIFYPTEEDYEYVGREKYRQIGIQGTGTVETRWRRKDGSIINVLLSSTPMDPGDLQGGVTFTALDITERKRAEEALKEAKMQAELYLDLMGHDINNMNQIALGYLELANDVLNVEGKLDKEHQSLIAKPMETLLNNSNLIRNVRKLQNEKAGAYEPQMIAIDKVLGDVVGQFSQVAGRDVKIGLHACRCIVKANELIRDVFQNLIGNAIKHSAGPVEINVKAEKQEQDGKSYCRITVEDNGPGVPDIVKQKLFDRLSLERTRASGKGFGLCLTKMLVEDYKGKFWVEDRVHGDHTKGARFVVMLPVVNGP